MTGSRGGGEGVQLLSRRRVWAAAIALGILALLLAPRLAHLRGPIDEPQSFRQSDTAHYARAFYREGINLLAPSVCWRGAHKTIVLEFPFPEAVMALAYHVFGYHLGVARLVVLLFFLGSAGYLFLIVRHLATRRLAAISTVVYGFLPLSLFYSRAIHIDFCVVCFAHAMLYHFMLSVERSSRRHFVAGTAAALLVFLIKAPYAFYLVLPLAVLAARRRPSWGSWLVHAAALLAAAAAFWLWRMHADAVNSRAPDWWFIPRYFKHVNLTSFYFGPAELRWSPAVWSQLLGRFRDVVASGFGTILFLVGAAVMVFEAARGRWRQLAVIGAWWLGLLCYLLIFLNLNHRHDYYQIPFLAPVAVVIAVAVEQPLRWCRGRFRALGALASYALLAVLVFGCWRTAERSFYSVDQVRLEGGLTAAGNLPAAALPLVSREGRRTGHSDPRFLFLTDRYGWSMSERLLSPALLPRYRQIGATHFALLTTDAGRAARKYRCSFAEYPLTEAPWRLVIADLASCGGRLPPGASTPSGMPVSPGARDTGLSPAREGHPPRPR